MIGIIVAMEEELQAIKRYVTNIVENDIYDLKFIEGNLNNKNIVLCKSGIGKVNASRTTQVLIDNYDIDYIINIGVAGGVSDSLNVGDIVIGKYLVQHDFDITKFGHEKGFITGVGKEIYSDPKLVNIFSNGFKLDDYKIVIGTIASGDIFCIDPNMSLKIHKKFQADCVEMEGAAIAQVCFLCKVPFIVIRSISDVVNGSNEVVFDEFLTSSANIVARLIVDVITK